MRNLSIYFPYAAGSCFDVATYTKDELINELFDIWEAGYYLIQVTTELPKSIIDLSKFDAELLKCVQAEGLKINQAHEDHVKEVLEQCITDEWNVLNELINNHDEDFAKACLEYANGGNLEDAEDKYIGQYDSDKEFVETVFSDVLCDMPKHLHNYFDWDSYTNDVMHDYTEINGYYFRS